MSERQIIFGGPMVRALLDERKTQTRRVMKPQPALYESHGAWGLAWGKKCGGGADWLPKYCPYGAPGDRLWVRETWQYANWTEDGYPFIGYRADASTALCERDLDDEWSERLFAIWEALSVDDNFKIDNRAADRRWRSPIFMPRWASRITLEITGVRVERLADMREADAIAEGCFMFAGSWRSDDRSTDSEFTALACYESLWESINGKSSPVSSNPWVWVVEFKNVSDQRVSP